MSEVAGNGSAGSQAPPLRWAVAGIGRHSRQYVIPAIARSERAELTALVSSDPDGARRFGEAWGVTTVHDSYEEALADPGIDAVFLVSPNDAHHRQVLAAAAAGKHVLCEKPLATSVADAAEMVRVCEERGVVLGTGFHLRHNQVHRRAQALIAENRIGDVLFVSARYAHRTAPRPQVTTAAGGEIPPVAAWRRDVAVAGGGAFVSTGSHAIDLIRFLTGAEIVELQACADAEEMREHNLVASGRLGNGAIVTVQAGELAFPVNETTISGARGSIVCRGSAGNLGEGTLTLVDRAGEETFRPPVHDVYAAECEAFAAAVEVGGPADASGLDGLRCQEAIAAVYASVAGRRPEQVRAEPAAKPHEQVKE
jgi:1,5-anhydro-D-fructose reductase (1,5-anhydro-D-mannitol-forming)